MNEHPFHFYTPQSIDLIFNINLPTEYKTLKPSGNFICHQVQH